MLCLTLVFPSGVFAAESMTVGFDAVKIQDKTAVLPMYISDIPYDLTNISALTIHFTYDTSVLSFSGLADGSITNIREWYNQSEKNPNKVIVSWFDASSDNSNALTEDNVGKSNPIFYAEFEILDASALPSWINIETVSAYDYSSNPAKNIATKSGAVIIVADVPEDNTGDDSGDNGDIEGDGNVTEDGGEDNEPEDENNGSNTDNNTNNNGGNNNSTDSGVLRPSLGGNNSGSQNNDKKEETNDKEEVQKPETPEIPEADKVLKASEVFSDVDDNHWAAKSVVKLNQLGIVSGDSEKRANLDNKITRAETSKLALLVSGKEVKSGLSLDVKDSSDVPDWAKDFMSTAVEEGIFSGYEDGTIKPLNNITRAEMVAVIIKSLKIDTDENPSLNFADNDAIAWAAPYVAKAVELGFVNGYEDNTFKPAKDITRAEAFAVFARVAEYLGK